jgi:hypothetical protein
LFRTEHEIVDSNVTNFVPFSAKEQSLSRRARRFFVLPIPSRRLGVHPARHYENSFTSGYRVFSCSTDYRSKMKPVSMTWQTIDWEALDRLRDTFLSSQPSPGNYWMTWTDLASYDLTFAQRIGWKWDAVIAELKRRGWSPPAGGTLLDWGCGSGIGSRCVLDGFGSGNFARLELFDRSSLAMEFAGPERAKNIPACPSPLVVPKRLKMLLLHP